MNKIIHYCWFGGKKLPKLAKKCIRSWEKYLPDYEIKRWDETNFDVKIIPFSEEAYKCKKWAFVSDVARIYALKKYGGVYFDTDMLVTKNIDFLLNNDFFAGWESKDFVAVGVLGAKEPNNEIINELFNIYSNLPFSEDAMFLFSMPKILTKLLFTKYKLEKNHIENQKLVGNVYIYSKDYFYPINGNFRDNYFTNNTCMIHYYCASWISRSDKRCLKLYRIFGEQNGEEILKILRTFKHIGKATIKLILFPAIKIRKKIIKNREMLEIEKVIEQTTSKIEEANNYIVIHNPKWLGTTYATKELFENLISIPEIDNYECCKRIAQKICNKKTPLVVFSGFAIGWEKIARHLKKINNDIIIKVIWHGSNSLHIEDYDWLRFTEIIKLHNDKIIKSIGFVKKSMTEFYRLKGYRVEFIMNNVHLQKDKYLSIDSNNRKQKVKIGLYASGNRWTKNFYNQLAAASLVSNAIVDCIPSNGKVYEFAEILDLNIIGINKPIPREELLKRMSDNDINIYVTFTECAPMLPLESFELGVPCITGNNHHYWENHELRKYLVVEEIDNVLAIYDKIIYCLQNKELVLHLYKTWKQKYDQEVEENISKFINE
jgi:mannosyltransferase OCH1-like enzyme